MVITDRKTFKQKDYTKALGALGMKFEDLTKDKQQIVKEELEKQIHEYCNAG